MFISPTSYWKENGKNGTGVYTGKIKSFGVCWRISISNNLSENSIRAVALARKNFLFSDTPQGAKASALVFSIIETAKANSLDPYEYLVYILRNLPNLDFNNKPELLEGFMPWADSLPKFCYVKKPNKEEEAEEGK